MLSMNICLLLNNHEEGLSVMRRHTKQVTHVPFDLTSLTMNLLLEKRHTPFLFEPEGLSPVR